MGRAWTKIGLLTGIAVIAIAAAPPARAQEEGAAESASNDIVVTARRVEERLQDVPISITVFNQQQLSNRNIVTATDLGTYTPSLSVNQRYGPEKSSFAIRGFVQEPNTSPSVGIYFADVVVPRAAGGTGSGNNAQTGSFMDLQNVQVLKGPQGTLFGRNTTGGAVLLVPQKPTGRLEGYVEGSAGDFNMWRLQGALNVPLSDTFKVRLSVDRNQRDGYMVNHSGIGPDNYNDVNYFAARLGVVQDLTPDLENYIIASYNHSFSRGYAARILTCNPAANSGGPLFTALPACDQLARQNARGDGPLDVDVNNPNPFLNIRHWQVVDTTTWKASDQLTVKNIVSYAEYRDRASFSLNGDNFVSHFPAGVPLPNGIPFSYILLNPNGTQESSAQSTFTEELQFQGHAADDRLTWQAGGYFELSKPLGWNASNTAILLSCTDPSTAACTNPFGSGSISVVRTKYTFSDHALYGQATYKITDHFSITGGIRYTWDKTEAIGENTRLAPQANGSLVRTCNDVVRFYTLAANGTHSPLVVTDSSQCHYVAPAEKSDAPTWLIDLDYKPTDALLLYAKYARGYRQGGISLANIGLESWGPEKVESYEIGAKASFVGAVHGYFNIAGFYNDFTNQQLTVNAISNVPGFAGAQPIVNAGKSKIQGVEVDASATFFENLRLDLGYTYLDTKLKSINLPPIPTGAPYSALIPTALVGGPLALSPKNRVTATGTYTLPLAENVGKISLGATITHTDSQVFTQATLPQYRNLPPTDLLNLNVNWNGVMGQPVDLSFFMTNVTNQIYLVAVGSAYNSAGFENGLYGAPRMFGFRVRYNFGS